MTHGAPYGRHEVVDIGGLRALGPARTAIDMVRLHGLWPGVAACDAALRSGLARTDLTDAADRMQGWPYKTVVDRAIALADPGAESYLESLGRGLVIELGIGTPVTQFVLSDGHRTVRGDIRVNRHLFEIDGRLKYFLQQQGRAPEEILWEEKLRQDFITGFKLGVSRITAFDCHGGRQAALRRLAPGVRRHGATLRHRHERPRAVHGTGRAALVSRRTHRPAPPARRTPLGNGPKRALPPPLMGAGVHG